MKNPLKNNEESILKAVQRLRDEGWYDPYQPLSDLLEVPLKNLLYWLYRKDVGSFYETFRIMKRTGGYRTIYTPTKQLKTLQTRLNYIIQLIAPVKSCVHGFAKDKSIVTNAKTHEGQSFILNFDLEDFFPSIHFGRVYGLFKAKPFSFSSKTSAALAKLCTYNNILPQGAPSSPAISNLICRRIDQQLGKLSREHGCIYSRYADDITISTGRLKFPEQIAVRNTAGYVLLGDAIKQIIQSNDFRINNSKSRLLNKNDRQIVTGLVVNKNVNITRKYARQVRGMLHALNKYGLEAASDHFFTSHYFKHRGLDREYLSFKDVLHGKLTFIRHVREYDKRVDTYSRILLNNFHKYFNEYDKLLPETQEEVDKQALQRELENIANISDNNSKGKAFEKFLIRFFLFNNLKITGSFQGLAEEIDGCVLIGEHTYLIEAKYKKNKTQLNDLTSFQAKVRRRSSVTRGIFISYKGFTSNAVEQFQREQNPNIVLLIDGTDIKYVIDSSLSLEEAIQLKLNNLAQHGNLAKSLSELHIP